MLKLAIADLTWLTYWVEIHLSSWQWNAYPFVSRTLYVAVLWFLLNLLESPPDHQKTLESLPWSFQTPFNLLISERLPQTLQNVVSLRHSSKMWCLLDTGFDSSGTPTLCTGVLCCSAYHSSCTAYTWSDINPQNNKSMWTLCASSLEFEKGLTAP